MSMRRGLVVLSALLCLSSGAAAIDGNARSIDWVSLDIARYNSGEAIGASLWEELALRAGDGDWAILLGGSYGTVMPDGGDEFQYWRAGLGLKFYLISTTSLSVLAHYMRLQVFDDPDIVSAEAQFKHRFVPAIEALSPYVIGGASLRNVEKVPERSSDKRYQELVATAGAGCDFLVREDFAIGFEGLWNSTTAVDDDETPNWWQASVAMKYYWGR